MKLLNILAVAFACAAAIPVWAEGISSHKELYQPPVALEKQVNFLSKTDNSVTFRFEVKPVLGACSNIKMFVKVLGNDKITAAPDTKEFEALKEGEAGTLDFVLPITEEQAKDPSLKIQGRVEYIPDYEAIINAIEAGKETTYQSDLPRERLLSTMKENQEKQNSYSDIVRYTPNQNEQ